MAAGEALQPRVVGAERLVSLLGMEPTPILFLGAGASRTSGIPLAGELTEHIARWAYAVDGGRSPDDPRIRRSDWFPWLGSQPWYQQGQPAAENYPGAVQHLLQPRQNRHDFFMRMLRTGVPPSAGYVALTEMLARRVVMTVLTTNFDDVLSDAARDQKRPHHLSLIRTPDDYTKISSSPAHPQVIYLHGSVEHYTDQNLEDEVRRLNQDLPGILQPLLRDHPLVVVGYRGSEQSIMTHLLGAQVESTNGFRHGVYWCSTSYSGVESLHPMVQDLSRAIGGNFNVIKIEGFDELMTMLASKAPSLLRVPSAGEASASPPDHDFQPVPGKTVGDLDVADTRARLSAYARAMHLPVNNTRDPAWLHTMLASLSLAEAAAGDAAPTNAGYLLFGKNPNDTWPAAVLEISVDGPQHWVAKHFSEATTLSDGLDEPERPIITTTIRGNLWRQLDLAMEILAAVNKPFRLKGDVSTTVFPYSPLALKELLVNALAHRDYSVGKATVVQIAPDRVRICNPGGLVDEVQGEMGEGGSIELAIMEGRRGIKGYRNPVLADLFYGAGAMDKRGTGLSDAYRLTLENGGKIQFGPSSENDAFVATLFARREIVDESTQTATPIVEATSKYLANFLPVVAFPKRVWHASTQFGRARDLWKQSDADALPPFVLWNKRLFCFSDLDDESNPLSNSVEEGTSEELGLEEFQALDENVFVWLINEHLCQHFESRGMIVDKRRRRAYFGADDGSAAKITYQARVRQATRTVATPRVSSSTGKVLYWEHKAFWYSFRRFTDTWGLVLTPTYVFTFDGIRGLIARERITSLATRRASRDYNQNVRNDVVFWATMLAPDASESFTLRSRVDNGASESEGITFSTALPTVTLHEAVSADAESDEEHEDDSELEEELAKLAEEAAQEGERSTSADGSEVPHRNGGRA